MDPLHSLPHSDLSEIFARSPIPVQVAMAAELSQVDIIRLVTTLDDKDCATLAKSLTRIYDITTLSTLVINVLRMQEKKSYPFLAKVISLVPDDQALALANLVVNNGTHEQMDGILGDDTLSLESMSRLVLCDSVRDKVVAVTSKLWALEQQYHTDPTKDVATRVAELNREPVFDEYVSLREEPQSVKEERWLKSEHKLLFNNNNDIARVREDWPKQRAWYEGLLHTVGQAQTIPALKVICDSMRTQVADIHTNPSKGIRFAYPALTNYDLERIDALLATGKFSQAKKGVQACLAEVIRRHDELQLFPRSELSTNENDMEIIAITAPELYSLSIACDAVAKEAKHIDGDKNRACKLLGDIDLYLFRAKQLLRFTSKHLQHILFTRNAGLFTIHTVNHLDYCPKLQAKLEDTIVKKFLKDDGKALLAHYRGLRKATRELAEKFEQVATILKSR